MSDYKDELIRRLQIEYPELKLSELEVDYISRQLTQLLMMVKKLDEVDVREVEPCTIFKRVNA